MFYFLVSPLAAVLAMVTGTRTGVPQRWRQGPGSLSLLSEGWRTARCGACTRSLRPMANGRPWLVSSLDRKSQYVFLQVLSWVPLYILYMIILLKTFSFIQLILIISLNSLVFIFSLIVNCNLTWQIFLLLHYFTATSCSLHTVHP